MSTHPSTLATGPLVPRLPLLAMGLLVLVSLAGVAVVRLAGVPTQQLADAATVASRALHFEDQADGGIAVRDAATGQLLHSVAPGSNGFLRSTMRSLVRERKRQSLGPQTPFQLLARADGRLTLLDPSTGRRIDLEAFGPSNARVFTGLLPLPARTPPAETKALASAGGPPA